ncbi:MAG TPA: hypothetical protein VEU11_08440 [Terriglobales bacterium]|nr:hypothetical protein [Terriglobales bacterium]
MRGTLTRLKILGSLLLLLPVASAQQLQHRPLEQNPRVVACRVKEAHASRDPAAGLVVFTQRDKAEAERFRALLHRAEEGGPVEFQSSDGGAWQAASVVRLKSCFGRGLLVLPAGTVPPAEGGTFLLRFPIATLKPA